MGRSSPGSSRTPPRAGGKVIIPSFAIGRVEELIYWLKRLEDEAADSGAAGVPRQPDGHRRPGAVHAARPGTRSRAAARSARRARRRTGRPTATIRTRRGAGTPSASGKLCAFCTERFRTVPTGQESRQLTAVETARDRHLGERHGDRRPRAPPSGGRPARLAQYRPLRGIPGRRHPRTPARRRRPVGSRSTDTTCPSARRSSRSAPCRRMPIRQRSCDGLADSPVRRR